MANISIQKRLEIDKRKLENKTQKLEDLKAIMSELEAEIKIIKNRIDYNEKKWNKQNPNTLDGFNEQE